MLELMEDSQPTQDPAVVVRPRLNAQTRSVTISVPNLGRSASFLRDILGMRSAAAETLHTVEHEQLWGLAGARREVELLWSGNFWVELVHYLAPAGASRPVDYRISDQGIINLALGPRSRDSFRRTRDVVLADGHLAHAYHCGVGVDAQYVEDDQGFSFELLAVDPSVDADLGFSPAD